MTKKYQISNLPACRQGRGYSPPGGAGFTLIEILVSVTLIGIIGAISSQVFISGFKSQYKSEIIKEVKQNGDYALSVIERMVRNAADFSPDQLCNQDESTLSIVNPDGYTTIFNCDATNYNISSVSATVPGITPTGVLLMSNKVAVPAGSCRFRIVCPPLPLSPKYVFVSFTLTQAAVTGQPTPLPENTASVEYQGTYSLGNYK